LTLKLKSLERYKDGVIGELVMNVLEWEAAPPLRYAWGDLIQVLTEPCPCGMPGPRIKMLGRVDDLLMVKGVNVYPAAIKDIVVSFTPRVTGEMRIILESPPPRVVPPLKMKVEYGTDVPESGTDQLRDEIRRAIQAKLRVNPEVEMVPPNTLERDTAKKVMLFEKRY
jgi:phenylacetate-CoA ligase